MTTFIYNISQPDQGGVGTYVHEITKRAKIDLSKYYEIDSSSIFGSNYAEKLNFIFFKRKKFLRDNLSKFSDVNHFLQVEMFFNFDKGKNVVTFHNPPPFTKYNDWNNIYNDIYRLSTSVIFYKRYKEAIRTADFIIANSEFTKEGILSCNFDEDKLKVIHLGVDSKFRVINNFENRKNVLGYVGSFAKHKQIGRALNEYKNNHIKFKDYEFNLWGWKGVEFQKLSEKYNGTYNINFCGKLDQGIVEAYNSFKACIFPTNSESFGLPIVEAVACGTPTFVYEDAEIPPEVKKYAISINNVSEIPEILEDTKSKELIKLSNQVKEEFNWEKNYKETKRIYQTI